MEIHNFILNHVFGHFKVFFYGWISHKALTSDLAEDLLCIALAYWVDELKQGCIHDGFHLGAETDHQAVRILHFMIYLRILLQIDPINLYLK